VTVTVKLFASLQQFLPAGSTSRQVKLDVTEGSNVGHVLTGLGVPKQNAHLIMINGQQAGWDDVLNEGDTLSVFPPVAGG